MIEPIQYPLRFPEPQDNPIEPVYGLYSGREIGTFKDSLRAPIHGWFRYPAGYSYKFVNENFRRFGVSKGDWVYDPFSGTGTTLICAKQNHINAYGVEAHTFVHWVASVKLYWEFDPVTFPRDVATTADRLRRYVEAQIDLVDISDVFPELVYKCYHPQDLKALYLAREYILREVPDHHLREFLKLALTDTLRGAAAAGTGWPYIAPRKNTGRQPPRDALRVLEETLSSMCRDLTAVLGESFGGEIYNVLGDSRQRQNLEDGQIKLALTSPPYLNNYDYGDRTRLEVYFWNIARSWADISRMFRDKLMIAATTQVIRSKYNPETALNSEIQLAAPGVYRTVQQAVLELMRVRKQKGGKKDYDLMTALYFNDMFAVLKETYRLLATSGSLCLVLGDSAPYGVHIPTDALIGELGVGIGFSGYSYHELRLRGDKWKANPQRHAVPLREGVVVLTKRPFEKLERMTKLEG